MVTLHGLRHTAASIMLGAGVPLLVVSRQLGHASPQITAAISADLSSDRQLDAAVRAFQVDADAGGHATLGEKSFDEAAALPETLPPCKRQVRGSSPLFGSHKRPAQAWFCLVLGGEREFDKIGLNRS
jgi:Phage integrase family